MGVAFIKYGGQEKYQQNFGAEELCEKDTLGMPRHR